LTCHTLTGILEGRDVELRESELGGDAEKVDLAVKVRLRTQITQ